MLVVDRCFGLISISHIAVSLTTPGLKKPRGNRDIGMAPEITNIIMPRAFSQLNNVRMTSISRFLGQTPWKGLDKGF